MDDSAEKEVLEKFYHHMEKSIRAQVEKHGHKLTSFQLHSAGLG